MLPPTCGRSALAVLSELSTRSSESAYTRLGAPGDITPLFTTPTCIKYTTFSRSYRCLNSLSVLARERITHEWSRLGHSHSTGGVKQRTRRHSLWESIRTTVHALLLDPSHILKIGHDSRGAVTTCGLWHWHVRATRSNHTITFCTTCLPIAHQHQGLQPHPFECGSPMAPVLLSINMR